MKSVLLSIRPKWCELIASGEKTIEVRKTRPKISLPFKCYIYCTRDKEISFADDRSHNLFDVCGNGKVIGEFICSEITEFESEFWDDETYERIQTIIKDYERYFEFDECDYETVATNEDEKYKENWLCRQSCVSWEEMRKYIGAGITKFYGWHISDLKIYDKPKELGNFWKADKCPYATESGCTYKYHCFRAGQTQRCGETLTRPPQSWCYVQETRGENNV